MVTYSTNKEWLDLTIEETLEPELEICDPHHHLWDYRLERAAQTYLLPEFLADLNSGHKIVSTVFIECGAMYKKDGPEAFRVVGETEFVNGVAAMSASGLYGGTEICAGIVGHANLSLGKSVGPVLDALIDAGGGRFRGIRHIVSWDKGVNIFPPRNNPPPQLLYDKAFREGFEELQKRNLSFEAWCYHSQIPEVTDLARAFPNTVIILDHFGSPLGIDKYAEKKAEVFEAWQKDITELSKCPNVYAKLGGINMELNGFGWHKKDRPPTSEALMLATRPYYEHTISKFGVDRCLFESNFPVDMVTCSYNVLWNSFKRLTKGYSKGEKDALYRDTATRIYRI